MKTVSKYNTYKGISTVLTIGTPIISLCSCSNFFVHRSDTAVSAAGVFAILLTILFAKDKIAEHLKMPSAFILSSILFILILIVESIIIPIKYICIATMITSGIDELTFKRFYKAIESRLPDDFKTKKVGGFLITTSSSWLGE